MNAQAQPLEIQFHLTSGAITRFAVDDAAAAASILGQVQPHRVFAPAEIVIGGNYSMTVIRTADIARIDFITDGYPGWPFSTGITDARQITHEEFEEQRRGIVGDTPRTERTLPAGLPVTAFAELEFHGAERLFLEVSRNTTNATPVERGLAIHQMLQNTAVFVARRRGGGAILANGVHLVRLSMFPGPPETPPNAWPARRLTAP